MRICWKPFLDYDFYGGQFLDNGELLDLDVTLLHRIESMPPGIEITFAEARKLQSVEHFRIQETTHNWKLSSNFMRGGWVTFLKNAGYKIVLDDTEYEILEDMVA